MKALATLLFIVLTASIVHAQEAVPWPPDPIAIFARNFEFLSGEQIELLPYPMAPTATPLPINQCPGSNLQQWAAWVLQVVENSPRLCANLTGELSPPLPQGYIWGATSDSGELSGASTSPDGKRVVFLGQHSDLYHHVSILLYDTAAQTFSVIGDIMRQPHLRFEEWVSNQILLLDTYDTGAHNVYSHFIYVIDLRYQTITQYGIDHGDAITYYPDPPRLITRTGSEFDLHCTQTVYEIETRQLVTQDYGAFCQPEYRDVATGATYYRLLTPDGRADVVRYNHETGEQAMIYHGAVEHIDWISRDEHLAWLTMNDKGRIFVTPLMGSRSFDYAFAHLMLIDLTTGEMLYQTPAVWNGRAGYWSPTADPYFENWFFISTIYGNRDQLGQNRLIQLENSGKVRERIVDGNLKPPFWAGWAFMTPPIVSEVDRKVDLYNLYTGQIIRLIEAPDEYRVEVAHLYEDVFRVTIAPLSASDPRRGIYVVRVSGVDIPATS